MVAFVNCSNAEELDIILSGLTHPQFKYTAIYDAIANGTLQIGVKDKTLPGFYIKTLILVTDGAENDSTSEIKQAVRDIYPNPEIQLYVVGVGDDAKVSEFEGIADKVIKIDRFEDLLAALTAVLELVPGVSQSDASQPTRRAY